MSIWRQNKDYFDKPKRNTFDLSYQNCLTTKFGAIVPCYLQEVLPGASYRIDPTVNFKLQPMVWPVQTRMTCYTHFFYVKNRTLYEDWMDFIGKNNDSLSLPYLCPTADTVDMYKTGHLADYLGLPTRHVSDYFEYGAIDITDPSVGLNKLSGRSLKGNLAVGTLLYDDDQSAWSDAVLSAALGTTVCLVGSQHFVLRSESDAFVYYHSGTSSKNIYFVDSSNKVVSGCTVSTDGVNFVPAVYVSCPAGTKTYFRPPLHFDSVAIAYVTSGSNVLSGASFNVNAEAGKDWLNPDSLLPHQTINALPFRAYEMIYNTYYRNDTNDPYILNGQTQYNQFIPTKAGGADSNMYDIRFRNWELDQFTSAVQSPQQGPAPLVGITSTGLMTFKDNNGEYQVQAQVGDDGDTITGISVKSPDIPTGTLRALVDDVSSYGITISDLRNVNALQRWLEKNARRGRNYKAQMESHYGVSVSYDSLELPEFIGGFSSPVVMEQVTQQTETASSPLGMRGGSASVYGNGRTITKYCDEHGYIIGLTMIVPVPNYSQALQKHFTYRSPLDYYTPEFGKIGYQAVGVGELTPVNCHYTNTAMATVFGYQRPWYQYLGRYDEAHGEFRTTMANYLMSRTFGSVPQLGTDFTIIDPKQVNDVFAVIDDTDKIIGQFYFNVSAKLPIPLFGVPSLE